MRAPRQLLVSELTFRFDLWVAEHCLIVSESGAEYLVCCPRCGREKCAVNVRKKRWRCFVCDFSGSRPLWFVAEVGRTTLAAAEAEIDGFTAGIATGPVGALEAPTRTRADHELPVGSFPPLTDLGPEQLAYWDARGFPRDHIRALGVRTPIDTGTPTKANALLPGRLLFPIWSSIGRPVGWASRAIRPNALVKVLNGPRSCREPDHAPGCTCFHASWGLPEVPNVATADEMVLGLHLLQRGQPAVLVEGITDVAACGPGFVASLGAKLSPQQAALIAQTGVSSVTVLFDPDEPGRRGAVHAHQLLRQFLPTATAECPAGTDPGSLGRAVCLDLVTRPVTLLGGLADLPVRSEAPAGYNAAPKPFVGGF